MRKKSTSILGLIDIYKLNTKYEKDFLELEEKYKNKEIDIKEYNKLWNEIIKKILDENRD